MANRFESRPKTTGLLIAFALLGLFETAGHIAYFAAGVIVVEARKEVSAPLAKPATANRLRVLVPSRGTSASYETSERDRSTEQRQLDE